MSHELRTPLNAIAGYVELIEMGLRGPITEAQREDLRRIRTSQRMLLRLVEDVLDVAKLETGRLALDMTDIPLHEVLASAEAMVFPQLFARSLVYEYRPCSPTLMVRADRERLLQVIMNLLTNAIKFTPNAGHIGISASAGDDADRVAIRVTDSGRGIPSDKLEAIFEPFMRVESTFSRSTEGTGLGLAIGRSLSRAMGGDLSVESTLGEGAVFTLTLVKAG
jgi:signal transduction histidine kinase